MNARPSPMEPAWSMALEASFGSVERWRDGFVAMGRSFGGESGSLLLVFQPRDGTLMNVRCADPPQGLAGAVAILALDVPGRADAAAADLEARVAGIDWAGVYARYRRAVDAATESLAAAPDDVPGRLLIDVRRAGVYEKASERIDGASWRDPAKVSQWAGECPAGREVVVYCVYGHEVGRATALRLRAAGVDARFLSGSFDAWKAAGRPLAAR